MRTRIDNKALVFKGLVVLASAGLFALSGCHVMMGPEDTQDWWYYCDASGCYRCTASGCEFPDGPQPNYCMGDQDCPSGTSCDLPSGYCITKPKTCAKSSQCSSGYVCLDKTCKPGRTPCEADAACGAAAYCSNGACKDSDLCTGDTSCAAAGAGFVCDARGTCVPGPPGPKACTEGAGCDEGFCVDGSCGACVGDCGGGKTCQLAVHCGAGRACLDGQCVNKCQTKADCGSAQVCVNGTCRLPASSCTKDTECGSAQVCANGVCYVDCSTSGTCTNPADVCSADLNVGSRTVRICAPDHAAKPECTLSKECDGSEQCVNGICRTTCAAAPDCANCNDGPVCGPGGFCMTADEVKPDCTLTSECTGSQICLDSKCQ